MERGRDVGWRGEEKGCAGEYKEWRGEEEKAKRETHIYIYMATAPSVAQILAFFLNEFIVFSYTKEIVSSSLIIVKQKKGGASRSSGNNDHM